MPSPDVISARRRCWHSLCSQLGIDDDTQRLIASSIIPESDKSKYGADGVVSRKPLFNNLTYWLQASSHLRRLTRARAKLHRRRDGSTGLKNATRAQINYALSLARKIGWDSTGEDDLHHRIERFASRQLNRQSEYIVPISFWSTSDARKIIDALKQMAARFHPNAGPNDG